MLYDMTLIFTAKFLVRTYLNLFSTRLLYSGTIIACSLLRSLIFCHNHTIVLKLHQI